MRIATYIDLHDKFACFVECNVQLCMKVSFKINNSIFFIANITYFLQIFALTSTRLFSFQVWNLVEIRLGMTFACQHSKTA